jgi:hypothetical protein
MSFALNTDDIRTLHDYHSAATWEAAVTPIRGSNPPIKPLGKRSKKHVNIRRGGEDIIVRLHRTDVVTYKPNEEIHLNTGGWNSQSTVKLLYAVLPWGIRPHLFKNAMWVHGEYEDEQGTLHTGKFRVKDNQITLTFNPETRNYRVYDPDPVYTHKINRKAKKEAVKPYADFIAWVKAICAVRAEDGRVRMNENEKRLWMRPCDADENMLSGDPALYYEAFLAMPNWQRCWSPEGVRTTSTTTSILRTIDTHILRRHASTILDRTQAPWGVQVDDRYEGYV